MINEMLSLAAIILPEEEIIEEIEKLCKEYKYSNKSKKSSIVNQVLGFSHVLTMKTLGNNNQKDILKLSKEMNEMEAIIKLTKPNQG